MALVTEHQQDDGAMGTSAMCPTPGSLSSWRARNPKEVLVSRRGIRVVRERIGDILFLFFVALLAGASYWLHGPRGFALLTLAFFLPLYPMRLVIWSSWNKLQPWLAARWSPLRWQLFAFGTWASMGAVVWFLGATMPSGWNPELPLWLRVCGGGLLIAGLALGAWAQWLLGLQTAILTNAIFRRRDEVEVVTGGPYAIAPHPIFVSEWLIVLGCSLTTSELWLLAILLIGVPADLFAARGEEKDLQARFGEKYGAYRSRFVSWYSGRKKNGT
jgi:protein-S-isoprenylcysteine O-methyltransferase Ste14